MRTKLDLFFKWGIELSSEYIVEKKEVKTVHYAGKDGLMREIERREGTLYTGILRAVRYQDGQQAERLILL